MKIVYKTKQRKQTFPEMDKLNHRFKNQSSLFMKIQQTKAMKNLFLFFSFLFLVQTSSLAQGHLEVTIQDGISTTTCGDIFGSPDPRFSVSVNADSWVTYPATQFCFTDFPNMQYEQFYNCPSDVPATINLCFRVFEDDGSFCNLNEDCLVEVCNDYVIPAPGASIDYNVQVADGQESDGELNFTIALDNGFTGAPNDLICDAIELGNLPYIGQLGNPLLSNYDNFCATNTGDANPVDDGGVFGNEVGVWFTFTTGPDVSAYNYVNALADPQGLGAQFRLQVAVYESNDGTCGDISLVTSAYEDADYDEVALAHCLQPNTRYYILIDAVNSPFGFFGYFGMHIVSTGTIEAADLICDAEDLGMVPLGGSVGTPLDRTNFCADNIGEPNPVNFDIQNAVWFNFQAPETGHVTIDMISDLEPPSGLDPIDLQFALYSSSNNACTGALTELNSVYDGSDLDESMEIQCLVPGQNYWVMIDGSNFVPEQTHGIFSITVSDAGPVAPQSTTVLDEIICNGGSLQVGDSTYTESGVIEEIVLAANGCDSLVIGNVTILDPITTTIDTVICNGESVTIGNSIYFESGNYSDVFVSNQLCDSTVFTNVTVLENVEAVAVQLQEASDIAASDGSATVTVTGGIAPYTYEWSTSETSQTIENLSPGLYCVTVTADNGCEDVSCISVLYPGAISVAVENGEVTCNGDTDGELLITITDGDSPFNYEWGVDFGAAQGNGIILNQGQSSTISNLAPGSNYTITVTDASGLIVVTSGEVLEPIPIVNNLDTMICFGETLTVGTAVYSTSGPILENLISPDGCDSLVTGSLIILDEISTTLDLTECFGTAVTVGNVDYTTTGPINEVLTALNGCDSTVTGFLTILPEIATPLDYTLCFGESVVVGDSTYNATGVYTNISLAANGCDSIITTTVQVLDELIVGANLVAEASGIGNPDGIAQAIAIGGAGNYTFLWSNTATGNVVNNLEGGQDYCVTVTDDNGCTANDCVTVLFPVDIQSNLIMDSLDCAGDTDGQISFTAFNGQAPYDYTWQNADNSLNGNGVIDIEGGISIINSLPAGIYTIEISDIWGSGTFTIEVVEPDPIIISEVLSVDATCFGTCDGSIEVEVNGGALPYSFQWSQGAGNTALIEDLCQANYELTVTDANGCTSTWNGAIDEPAEFIVEAVETTPVSCNEGNDGIATVTTNGTPISILWSNGEVTDQITDLVADTYTVTVTNSDNCTAEASIQISEPLSSITSDITIDEEVSCNGENDAIISVVANGGTDFTYLWNNGMTTTTLENLGAGTYTVTIEDGNGCQGFNEVTLSEPTFIDAMISTVDVNCFDGTSSGSILVSDVTGGSGNYIYSLNGFTFFTSPEFNGLEAGDYDVYVQDSNGCTESFPTNVASPGDIDVDLGDDFQLNLGETLTLDATTNSQSPVYEWSIDTCTTCPAIILNPIDPATYSVTVTDEVTGCSDTDQITVTIRNKRDVFIPNVFSPNFDGTNDVFIIYPGASVAKLNSFKVFNRWGGIVFQALDVMPGEEIGWDGTIKGKKAPDGVYVYLIDVEYIDGFQRLYRGDVTVVR